MTPEQLEYWNSFDIVSEPYRSQVVRASAAMCNLKSDADTVTIPLTRPLTMFGDSPVLPPFHPLPSIKMRRIRGVTWIPIEDVQNQ